MNKKNIVMGAAVASLIGAASMTVGTTLAYAGGPVGTCEGGNKCKGKGDCKTAKNACAGQNGCKGQSFKKDVTEKNCKKHNGTWTSNDAKAKGAEKAPAAGG